MIIPTESMPVACNTNDTSDKLYYRKYQGKRSQRTKRMVIDI